VWRANRDAQGYRVTKEEEGEEDSSLEDFSLADCDSFDDEEAAMPFVAGFEDKTGPRSACADSPPPLVMPVPRLHSDIDALDKIFSGDIERPVSGACCVVFGGGDASGEGFGSLTSPLGMPPLLRRGFWGVLGTSHWREMRNALEAIRAEARLGRLVGCEVWVATDNSTAEASFYKGRSSIPELDAMVLELRLLAI
jgi:hypothetical protein